MSLIDKIFKNKKNIRNCHHPDFAHLVEPAFVGLGVESERTQYYRFKGETNELDMIAGRYHKASRFLTEAQMKMDAETLMYYLDKLMDEINTGQAKITELVKLINIMRDRTNLLLEQETVLKLASASYFDENETLDGYDYKYNLKKINIWKQAIEQGRYEELSFFFTKPMSDLITLPKSWQEDLENLITYMDKVKTDYPSNTKD